MKPILRAGLAALLIAAASLSPAHAAPYLYWAQFVVSQGRFACKDTAVAAVRQARDWTVKPGKQSVEAEDREIAVWIRCWELPGGTSSVATIVAAVTENRRAAQDMVAFLRARMKGGN